jgi:NAD+ kinase
LEIRPTTRLAFFYRPDVAKAPEWETKITDWLKTKHPEIKVIYTNNIRKQNDEPVELLIVLGGDGTIIEAAKEYYQQEPHILGLNLGNVGFLATIRKEKEFLDGLEKIISGEVTVSQRMLLDIKVIRSGKTVFNEVAVNELSLQSLLSMLEFDVYANDHKLQSINGTGVLVSTATGSTAFNLSAHGPIVSPNISCILISELLDHNLPTPTLVLDPDTIIRLKVINFRQRQKLKTAQDGSFVDVIAAADSEKTVGIFPGDVIEVTRAAKQMRLLELNSNYFFKSLQEKFAFN